MPNARPSALGAFLAVLVKHLWVDPVVLRHDQATSRIAVLRLGRKDDPKEIDVNDARDLAIDADALAREILPGHDATVTSTQVFMSYYSFDEHVVTWLGDCRVALFGSWVVSPDEG